MSTSAGLDYLGELPEEWQVRPLKALFCRKSVRGTEGNRLLLSVYRDLGVVLREGREDNHNRAPDDLESYLAVDPGDLAVNKMKAWQGSVAVSGLRGIVSPAYLVCSPKHNADPRYIHHFLRCSRVKAYLKSRSFGVRPDQWDLRWDDLRELPVALPSLEDQRVIVRFLDEETAKIDTVIHRKRQLIASLAEYWRRRVLGAVGGEGSSERVPTGLDWLPLIPTHWELAPLYARFEVLLGKMLDQKRATGMDSRPYLRNVNIQWDSVRANDLPEMDFSLSERRRLRLKEGDLLVCEGGEVGRTAMWRGELEECYFQKAVHRLRPLSNRDLPRFFFYVMLAAAKTGFFRAGGNPNTIDHLTAEQLRHYRFPFPPIDEQKQIASALDKDSAIVDALNDKVSLAIKTLSEYRSALITAAVTGQIDVGRAA